MPETRDRARVLRLRRLAAQQRLLLHRFPYRPSQVHMPARWWIVSADTGRQVAGDREGISLDAVAVYLMQLLEERPVR
jgi:hypothetical protein